MIYCRICGDERAEYRQRSHMYLCDSCHQDTPAKAGYTEFLRVTGMADDAIAREFFSDYRASRHGDVADYWRACSDSRRAGL